MGCARGDFGTIARSRTDRAPSPLRPGASAIRWPRHPLARATRRPRLAHSNEPRTSRPWRRCGRVVEDPWRNGARAVESLLVGCGQTLGSGGHATCFSTLVHGAAGLDARPVDNHPSPSTRIHRGSTVPGAPTTGRARPLVPTHTGLGAAARAVLHAWRGSLLLRRRRNNAPAAPLTSAARERPDDPGPRDRPPTLRRPPARCASCSTASTPACATHRSLPTAHSSHTATAPSHEAALRPHAPA
jgi:hypothetical protein